MSVRTQVKDDTYFGKKLPPDLFEILNSIGGSTFENGLYRLHSIKSSFAWATNIAEYFGNYKNRIYPFGFDWMGRQFCMGVDNNTIFMFDPATAKDFQTNQSITLLHNTDFVNNPEQVFSADVFNRLLSSKNLTGISDTQCLGFSMPLFLGGKDQVDNYELQDIEVY